MVWSWKPFHLCLYNHQNRDTIAHLSGCSGLDSMVLGEPQILSPGETGITRPLPTQALQVNFWALFQHTFSVIKQILHGYGAIGRQSVSSLLPGSAVCTPDRSSVTCRADCAAGSVPVKQSSLLHVTSTSMASDVSLWPTGRLNAHTPWRISSMLYAIALTEIPSHLAEADIVISSTASPLLRTGKRHS